MQNKSSSPLLPPSNAFYVVLAMVTLSMAPLLISISVGSFVVGYAGAFVVSLGITKIYQYSRKDQS